MPPISCSQSLFLVIQLDSFNHRIPLRVNRDGADGLPVAYADASATDVADGRVRGPGVWPPGSGGHALHGARPGDVADTAVQMSVVDGLVGEG